MYKKKELGYKINENLEKIKKSLLIEKEKRLCGLERVWPN